MEKKEFGKEWQDEQREKMVRIQFPKTVKRIEEKAREEGKKEGIKQTKRKYENELRLYRSIQGIVKKWERKSEQLKKEFGISKLKGK